MIGLFVGKFQPPHLGHVISIMSIYNDYDKIIIGVTEGEPRVMSLDKTVTILDLVFEHLPKIEVYPIKGTLDNRSAIPYLPDEWDEIITGNSLVINLAKEEGWNYRYLPRTKGIGYSGTELRKLYEL